MGLIGGKILLTSQRDQDNQIGIVEVVNIRLG